MSHQPPRQGATSDQTPPVTLQTSVTVDHGARLVTVSQARPLDITPQQVFLPFDAVKGMYLQILAAEVQGNAKVQPAVAGPRLA